MQTPLPAAWVDSLFARLAVRYGSAWMQLWEGMDIAAVKADWSAQLAGLKGDAISYGLENLPLEKPPLAGAFRAICSRMPVAAPALPAPAAPPADPARVAAALGGLREKMAKRHPRAWAHALAARERACERLTAFQRFAWREALRTAALEVNGVHVPIDEERLPPSMRPPKPGAQRIRPEAYA